MTRKKLVTWEQTYVLPLKKDPIGYESYAWVNKNEMALTFTHDDLLKDEYDKIIDTINGSESINYPNLRYHVDTADFYDGERYIFCVRGLGHLMGGLKLNQKDAHKIQDDFADFIKSRLCR